MSKTSLVVRPRYEPSILEGAMKQFMIAQRREFLEGALKQFVLAQRQDSLLCKVCLSDARLSFRAPEQPCSRCSSVGQK